MSSYILNHEELRTFYKIDFSKRIEPEDRKVLPGLHFCPDADFKAVSKKSFEWSKCNCNTHKNIGDSGEKTK